MSGTMEHTNAPAQLVTVGGRTTLDWSVAMTKPSTRAAQAAAKRAYWADPANRERTIAKLRGRHPSIDTRAKMSASAKAKAPMTATHRERIAEAARGRPMSDGVRRAFARRWIDPDARLKMSALLTGHPVSAETRAKIGSSKIGQPLSDEHKRKLSQAGMGRVVSETHRALLRESKRGNRNIANATVKGECSYCGEPAKTIDHIIPRRRGGSNEPENLTPACFRCNQSKGVLTPDEWLDAGLYLTTGR